MSSRTGQPRRTTGLERLGFYGDAWAALRAGLWAAGPRKALGRRAALRVRPRAAPHAGPVKTNYSANAPCHAAEPSDKRTDAADTYQWTSRSQPYAQGSGSVGWSLLHTAGPNNSGRVTRLYLLGTAAVLGTRPAREEKRGLTRCGDKATHAVYF